MENQNSFIKSNNSNSNEQLIISYELLQLMEWMVEHESETLKKIISKALKRGFDEQLKQTKKYKELYSPEEMQNNIVEFLGLLEVLLIESTNEQETSTVIQKNLMPAIDHIDTNNCDSATLKSSIAVATSRSQKNSKEKVQDIFLKELLKRWKPNKNTVN